MKEQVDKSICPLCGKPNDCLLAKGNPKAEEDCWCRFEYFSEDLLKRVPADKKGKACVCRECVQNYQ